jgi:GNAT superfamily N-acetyltransferase
MRVIAREPATGEASRALFAEYMELVRARLGGGFVPTADIFATEEDFDAPGAAWLVAREEGRAVACGGVRPLTVDAGEIKRMFVTASARRRGHGRALLAELEGLAREAGCARVLVYTTEVLVEARALYRAEGYRAVGVDAFVGRIDLWLQKRL